MFFGDPIETKVEGFLSCKAGDKWTHWKLVIKRERYTDQAHVSVDVELCLARKAKNRHWYSAKGLGSIRHRVPLGRMENGVTESRFTVDSNLPADKAQIEKELNAAFDDFLSHYERELQRGRYGLDLGELSRCIKKACLKKAEG